MLISQFSKFSFTWKISGRLAANSSRITISEAAFSIGSSIYTMIHIDRIRMRVAPDTDLAGYSANILLTDHFGLIHDTIKPSVAAY